MMPLRSRSVFPSALVHRGGRRTGAKTAEDKSSGNVIAGNIFLLSCGVPCRLVGAKLSRAETVAQQSEGGCLI